MPFSKRSRNEASRWTCSLSTSTHASRISKPDAECPKALTDEGDDGWFGCSRRVTGRCHRARGGVLALAECGVPRKFAPPIKELQGGEGIAHLPGCEPAIRGVA